MVQLAFGLISDNAEPSWWMNILRTIFSAVDMVVYTLIANIYNVLFAIADSEIIKPELIKNLYGRIQLILGVVMIFKLATSILQVIINPDLLNDQKRGTGKIISKILIMLVLFTSIIPLNIPGEIKEKSYNWYISNNGLLFGTLYSFQHRILENNTLERFVFGSNVKKSGIVDDDGTEKKVTITNNSGSQMAAYVLRAFIRPNLKEGKTNLSNPKNYVCGPNEKIKEKTGFVKTVLTHVAVAAGTGAVTGSVVPGMGTAVGTAIGTAAGLVGGLTSAITKLITGENFGDLYLSYSLKNTTISTMIDLVNVKCDDGYAFSYLPIISSVCGIILLLSLIGCCINIAIRALKLAVLRLIAPIPIISYIDPKSSENGMFANWVKTLTSTYLDLFVRLMVTYFVIYIIAAIVDNKLDLGFESNVTGIIATIFVIIGLFKFLEEAPKFIGEALGIKGLSSGILSGVLGGTSALLGGAGIKGALAAGMSTAQATNAAAAQGKAAPPAWQAGADLAAQIKTGDPKARGGVMNAINDRLMRDAGINVARKKYGVTAQGLDLAKNKMFDDEKELNRSQDRYDRFVRGQMDQTERDSLIAQYGSAENARDALLSTVESNKKKYGQSKTNYEEAKKFGDSHRVTPSFEEEHRASWRERFHAVRRRTRLRDRPDMFNSRGEGATAHQNIMDRIQGSRETWSDVNSPRVDNRWSPGTTRGGNENAIHDNPDRTIDTPQAGSPPGGPHP